MPRAHDTPAGAGRTAGSFVPPALPPDRALPLLPLSYPSPSPCSFSQGSPPHCIGKSTTGEIGRYWHDPELEYTDEHTEAARLKNGVKKGFQEATVSRFALEALPIEHRLL